MQNMLIVSTTNVSVKLVSMVMGTQAVKVRGQISSLCCIMKSKFDINEGKQF